MDPATAKVNALLAFKFFHQGKGHRSFHMKLELFETNGGRLSDDIEQASAFVHDLGAGSEVLVIKFHAHASEKVIARGQ